MVCAQNTVKTGAFFKDCIMWWPWSSIFLIKRKCHRAILRATVLNGFQRTLRVPWTSKSSDFVEDILKKSGFQGLRLYDPFWSSVERLLDDAERPKWSHLGLQRSHKPMIFVFLTPLDARSGAHSPLEALKTQFFRFLSKFWPTFDSNYGNVGMRTFCFALNLMFGCRCR